MAKKTQTNPKTSEYLKGQNSLRDLIAPASILVDPKYIQVGSKFARTIFVMTYP